MEKPKEEGKPTVAKWYTCNISYYHEKEEPLDEAPSADKTKDCTNPNSCK